MCSLLLACHSRPLLPAVAAPCRRRSDSSYAREPDSCAKVSLDAIDQAEASANRSGSFGSIFDTNVSASGLIQNARDNSWFSYKNLEDAGFSFEWILGPFSAIFTFVSMMDGIWRTIESINILRKFWGRSALSIAPIDVTTDTESSSRARTVLVSPIRAMAMIITHPLMLTAVSLSFVFIIGGVVFSIYKPVCQPEGRLYSPSRLFSRARLPSRLPPTNRLACSVSPGPYA